MFKEGAEYRSKHRLPAPTYASASDEVPALPLSRAVASLPIAYEQCVFHGCVLTEVGGECRRQRGWTAQRLHGGQRQRPGLHLRAQCVWWCASQHQHQRRSVYGAQRELQQRAGRHAAAAGCAQQLQPPETRHRYETRRCFVSRTLCVWRAPLVHFDGNLTQSFLLHMSIPFTHRESVSQRGVAQSDQRQRRRRTLARRPIGRWRRLCESGEDGSGRDPATGPSSAGRRPGSAPPRHLRFVLTPCRA